MLTRREFLRLMMASSTAALTGSLASAAAQERENYVILLIVDAGRADVFYNAIRSGELPNIKEHIYDRGTHVENALVAFPTLTLALHPTIMTGYYPGHHGIISNVWFDRKTRTKRDYPAPGVDILRYPKDLEKYTIFELLSDIKTAAIFENCNRGATYKKLPAFVTIKLSVRGQLEKIIPLSYMGVDTMAAEATIDMIRKPAKKRPRLIVTWFFANDKLSHGYGPESSEADVGRKNLDKQIGRIVQALEKKQIYDRTTFILTADHGQSATTKHWNIGKFIADDLGIDVKEKYNLMDKYITEFDIAISPLQDFGGLEELDELVQAHKRILKPERYEAVVCASGNSFAQIYMAYKDEKNNTHWDKKPPLSLLRDYPVRQGRIDLIDKFRRLEAVDFLCVQDTPGKIHIFSKDGESVIKRKSDEYAYSVVNGIDPLGYKDDNLCSHLVDSGFHSADEWLEHTCDALRPNGPEAISQVFDSDKCGDILISAAQDWEICEDYYPHKGDHGRLIREDVRVPLIIGGYGIKKGSLKYARITDVCPTILEILGYRYDSKFVGKALFSSRSRKT
ncbi:alkaline phosphatase family protein [bacterium]|nr:alkaline phosphatase family protein [bacterium]